MEEGEPPPPSRTGPPPFQGAPDRPEGVPVAPPPPKSSKFSFLHADFLAFFFANFAKECQMALWVFLGGKVFPPGALRWAKNTGHSDHATAREGRGSLPSGGVRPPICPYVEP